VLIFFTMGLFVLRLRRKARWSSLPLAVIAALCLPRPTCAAEISFHNDVMPVLAKSSCNLGTCHGNARGKGGFQISLRGQEAEADYLTLTRELYGRRVNSGEPDHSLILLKPTMQLAHEGGKRFAIDSAEYQILRAWIAAGMPNDPIGYRQLVKLEVMPNEVYLPASTSKSPGHDRTGWELQIQAQARFSDGSSRDVTSLVVYEVAQPLADVSHDGRVTGRSAGETTVLVRYLNEQVSVRIAFLANRPGFAWSAPRAANLVDEHVFAKLRKLRINPSPVCDDATFIRRVTFDLLGLPPTSDEARQFIADTSTDKRAALIDALLERPEFADWWALKWADLLRIEEKTLDQKGVENFHSWLRDAFAQNKPLDQFAREIVSGRGSTYEVPPANFYRALRTPFERSEAVGQIFLGVRLQCTKCHNHPFDQWTQDDYYSWGNVFSRVDYKIIENNRTDSNDKHEFDGEQIVFLNETGEARDPRTNRSRPARFLGDAQDVDSKRDPLNELADWLTDAHRDRFVQMMANRIWQQVMGIGIVDPVDDFRATNPPSNPELLKALADELVCGPPTDKPQTSTRTRRDGAFDLRHLLRLILNSHTYQLTSEPNDSNREDEVNFSRAIVRRRSAEQLLDSIGQVLNIPLEFSRFPTGRRAAQLPGVAVSNRLRRNPLTDADRFLRIFGKPPRLQSCDCERSDETTLGQTFQLVSGELINELLTARQNRLDSVLASNQPLGDVMTELYWTTLTRPPSQEELTVATQYLEKAKNRRSAIEDVMWGLFNSNEFLLRR